ncbi:NU1M oxidoreductase, partial [Acromyrmex charruanus]
RDAIKLFRKKIFIVYKSNYYIYYIFRGISQTLSYEVSLIIIFLMLMILRERYSFVDFLNYAFIFSMFMGIMTELNRRPIDFVEGKSELVSGFNVFQRWFALIFMTEVKVRKAFKVQDRENKCTIIAELEIWEEKREVSKIFVKDKWLRWNEKERRIEENRLSKDYEWNYVPAKKEHKKGRAKGGIITAVNKKIKNIEVREISEAAMECDYERVYNGNKWRIITVCSQEVEKTMERLMEHIREEEEEYLIIGGDLNARTASERKPVIEKENEKRNKSKKSIHKIINGWTYIGEREFSVINYMIGNEGACKEIKRVEEGNRTELDHIPLEVALRRSQKKRLKVQSRKIKRKHSHGN